MNARGSDVKVTIHDSEFGRIFAPESIDIAAIDIAGHWSCYNRTALRSRKRSRKHYMFRVGVCVVSFANIDTAPLSQDTYMRAARLQQAWRL